MGVSKGPREGGREYSSNPGSYYNDRVGGGLRWTICGNELLGSGNVGYEV